MRDEFNDFLRDNNGRNLEASELSARSKIGQVQQLNPSQEIVYSKLVLQFCPMILILDGNSKLGAHVRSNPDI